MKLIRFGETKREKTGILTEEGERIDVSAFVNDYNEQFFREEGIKSLSEWLSKNKNSCPLVSEDVRWGVPLARPSKIVCVGLNYTKHAEESGMEVPKEPVLFFKATSSMVGPFDPIIIPKGSTKTDWEVELALVIGKEASYISQEEVLKHVA